MYIKRARGGTEGLGHRLAAAWVRFMRAAFVYCDGWLFAPRDDPTVIRVSAAGSAFRAFCLSSIITSLPSSSFAVNFLKDFGSYDLIE